MQLANFYAVNQFTGAYLPYPVVTVYSTGTTTLAVLYDANGNPISNPFTGTANGQVAFKAASGIYDIAVQSGSYTAPLIQQFALQDPIQGISWQGTYSAGTTYTQGQGVTYSGGLYVSLLAGNIGHRPDISPTYWADPSTFVAIEAAVSAAQGSANAASASQTAASASQTAASASQTAASASQVAAAASLAAIGPAAASALSAISGSEVAALTAIAAALPAISAQTALATGFAAAAATEASIATLAAATAQAAAGVANFYKIYPTHAAAVSDIANIPANSYVEILQDETQSGHQTIAKNVSGTLTLALDLTPAFARAKLSGPLTYYVRPDGSDSNTGLTNTSGGAFLTILHALTVIAVNWDLNFQAVTISCLAGTLGSPASYAPFTCNFSFTGYGTITITGDTTGDTVSGVTVYRRCKIVATGSTDAAGFQFSIGASIIIQGFQIVTNSGNCLVGWGGGTEIYYQHIDFTSVAGTHVWGTQGGQCHRIGDITISGGGLCHLQSSHGGRNRVDAGIGALTTNVTFTRGFAYQLGGETVLTGTAPWFALNGFLHSGIQWQCQGDGQIQSNGINPPAYNDLLGNSIGYYGPATMQTAIQMGVMSPVVISANTNNYSPSDATLLFPTIPTSHRIRLSSTSSYNITGLDATGIVDGQEIVLQNIGNNTITLTALDSNSISSNQFAFNANVPLLPLQSIRVAYDATNRLWRPA